MAKAKRVLLADLEPHPRNAEHRSMDDESREGLRQSIVEGSKYHDGSNGAYRLDTTITVNSQGNRILGGHRRVEVLKDLGQEWIDARDITWVNYEPDSVQETACLVKLNSPFIAGD